MFENFSQEFEYRWKDSLGRKCFLSRGGEDPLKYQVPTDLGMLALCAHYKIKKDFDIRFCPNIGDLPGVLEKIYQEVKDFDGECKKALIYSIKDEVRLDSHKERPIHVVPILFCKYQNLEKGGGYKIGIFFMDPSQQMNKINGTEEFREFMYQKRFAQGEKDTLLPLFTLKIETQADNFSCRIKALVDMRRALSMNGEDDFFRSKVHENWDNPAPTLLENLSLSLHKTTQNQKLLGELLGAQKMQEFSKVVDGKVTSVKRPAYLFHKTQSYLEDLDQDFAKNPKLFLEKMLEQSTPLGKHDAQIKECISKSLPDKRPLSSPKVSGVVRGVVAQMQDSGSLQGNVDGGRL